MVRDVSIPSPVSSRHVRHGIAWLVLAAVVGMFVALFWSAVFFSVCLSDTGGGPVGDSVQGRLCGDWGEWPGMYGALLILASAVVGILMATLLLHLSRDRSLVGLIVLALLVPAVLPTVAFSFVYYTRLPDARRTSRRPTQHGKRNRAESAPPKRRTTARNDRAG